VTRRADDIYHLRPLSTPSIAPASRAEGGQSGELGAGARWHGKYLWECDIFHKEKSRQRI
jgi:hypothetical protein